MEKFGSVYECISIKRGKNKGNNFFYSLSLLLAQIGLIPVFVIGERHPQSYRITLLGKLAEREFSVQERQHIENRFGTDINNIDGLDGEGVYISSAIGSSIVKMIEELTKNIPSLPCVQREFTTEDIASLFPGMPLFDE